MRAWPFLAITVVLGCAPMSSQPPGRMTADFVVAPDGDDTGPGTAGRPFATLARARDGVRQLVAAGLAKDVKVLLRGGTHYLPQGIVFGPEDSGTAGHRIAYAAWPGEAPVLVGGTPITGWTLHAENIWQAAIPEGVQPTQLFENGERLTLARAPNEGYFHTENAVAGQPKTAFVYRATDLDPTGWDWAEGRVFMWPMHDWSSTDKPITGIDTEKRIIRLQGEGGYDIRPNNRYFVQNVLALLDVPGECVIRLKERRLYVWPRKTPIEPQAIVAASAPNLIAIRGEGDKLVRNLHFEGLDLSVANGDLVSITGAEDCSIRFCKLENATQCGIAITGHAQRITVYGNLIRYHGLHGVSLQGRGPGQPDVNHHHTIENNHIHHCGRLVGHGYGVNISQSGHNRIVHNHIHHMPRYAATIKGVRFQVLKTQVKGCTFENRHDFLHSRNNLIAYNHIHHVNQDSQDTGAIESWGPGRDNVLDHNLIHDVGNTRFTLQSGLYLDDATDYFTVTNNVIYGVVGAGGDQPIYAKGIGNRIVNNILIVAPTNVTAIRSFFMADERCDGHEYARNIIVCEGAAEADRRTIYQFDNWSDDRVAAADRNLFWKPGGAILVRKAGKIISLDDWRATLGGKFDAGSVVADPLFHDLAGRDFRLRPDSPALELGFQPIDLSTVGLKPDFPPRLPRQ